MGKKKNPSEEEVREAYREVLGREPDAGGLQTYMRSGLTADKLKANLASSVEGQRRQADPAKYGAKEIDPTTLSDREKEYYEVWKIRNAGSRFYDIHKTQLKWAMDAMSAEAWKQEMLGNVEVRPAYKDPETGKMVDQSIIISEEALKALGGNLGKHYTGTKKGVVYYFPETFTDAEGNQQAVKLTGNFSKNEVLKNEDGSSRGMVAALSTGSRSGGLFEELGDVLSLGGLIEPIDKFTEDPFRYVEKYLGKGAAEFTGATFALSPLGDLSANVAFGSRGGERLDKWQAKTVSRVGIDPEDFEKFQDIQERVAVTAAQAALYAASPFTAGATAAAAMGVEAAYQGAKAYEASQYNRDFDWNRAAVDVAMAGIPVGKGASWATVGRAALKAGATSALQQKFSRYSGYDLAGRGIKSEGKVDWGQVGQSAAIGALGQYTAGVRMPGSNMLGVNLYTTGLRYGLAETDEDRRSVLFESMITAGSTAMSSFASGYTNKQGGFKGGMKSVWNSAYGTFDIKNQPNFFNPDPTRNLPWRQEYKNQMGQPRLTSKEPIIKPYQNPMTGEMDIESFSPQLDQGYGQFNASYSVAPVSDENSRFGFGYEVFKTSDPRSRNVAVWGTAEDSVYNIGTQASVDRPQVSVNQILRSMSSFFVPFSAYSRDGGWGSTSFSPGSYLQRAGEEGMAERYRNRYYEKVGNKKLEFDFSDPYAYSRTA